MSQVDDNGPGSDPAPVGLIMAECPFCRSKRVVKIICGYPGEETAYQRKCEKTHYPSPLFRVTIHPRTAFWKDFSPKLT